VSQLVISVFPGIGLLDRAFEEAGFTVVRGPDVLWGGDVRRFTPPPGVFAGVIGGPPCQCHCRRVHMNLAQGNAIAPDLVPDYARIVEAAQPHWFVMENVEAVPDLDVRGFLVQRLTLNARWVGMEQSRLRVFQYGSRVGTRIDVGPDLTVFDAPTIQPTCMASEGRHGRVFDKRRNGRTTSVYATRRPWARFCELQGLPADFLDHAPFTIEAKYRVVGNGVPLPLGRAIANAVKRATTPKESAA